MVEHEWIDGWCKHCGASEAGYSAALAQGHTSTCLERQPAPSGDRPEPARRVYASEDFDTIGKRLGELRGERDAALNADSDLITGFFASLTEDQKRAALAYEGPDYALYSIEEYARFRKTGVRPQFEGWEGEHEHL